MIYNEMLQMADKLTTEEIAEGWKLHNRGQTADPRVGWTARWSKFNKWIMDHRYKLIAAANEMSESGRRVEELEQQVADLQREVERLSRPTDQLPLYKAAPHEPTSVIDLAVMNEGRIRDELIKRGWTPPKDTDHA